MNRGIRLSLALGGLFAAAGLAWSAAWSADPTAVAVTVDPAPVRVATPATPGFWTEAAAVEVAP